MHFTSFLEEGRLTVALNGEIDHHCAKAYIQAISAKIEAYTPDVCILDFQDVSFVDSSVVSVEGISEGAGFSDGFTSSRKLLALFCTR